MGVNRKPKLVIWGASHHAAVVADIVRLRDEYELVGFLDDLTPNRHGSQFFGGTVLGGSEQLDPLLNRGVSHLIIGFGKSEARLRLADLGAEKGYRLATAIHPQAVIAADVPIGCGTVIKAGAVIEVGASIGENVIIGSNSVVSHGSTLEDGSRLAAGAIVGSGVRIGRCTLLGINSCTKNRVRVGADSLIGAGSVVLRDIPDGAVAYGVPARVVREVTTADIDR